MAFLTLSRRAVHRVCRQNADLQVNELTEYAAFRKWETVETYGDKMSGAKDRRPAFDRLIADAKRGKVDVVAVWRFDRFARSNY